VSLANRNTPGASTGKDANSIDASWLSSALSSLPSRKMFPAPLTPVKDALAHTLAGATAAAASPSGSSVPVSTTAADSAIAWELAQQAAAPAQLVAAPPGLSKELEKALQDIEAAAAAGSNGGSSAGSSVLEPSVKQDDAPKKQQQPKQQPKAAGPIKSKESLKKSSRSSSRQQQQQQQQEEERAEEAKRLSKRDQELRDRKAYLKNFWYAAGEPDSRVVLQEKVGGRVLGWGLWVCAFDTRPT
jgi:hypothetical protein